MARTIQSNKIPVACFAPPLSESALDQYKYLIREFTNRPHDAEELETVDALKQCLQCVEAWWELPESKRKDVERWNITHRGQDITYEVVPLEKDHVAQLWEVTPWPSQCKYWGELFEKLPSGTRE